MKVHRALGPGFLESVYQEALEREFIKEGIPYEKEQKIKVLFEGEHLDKYFRVDFFCYGQIILEIKAVAMLPKVAEQILLNYLKASSKKLGLLINFGEGSLNYKRIVNSKANLLNSENS